MFSQKLESLLMVSLEATRNERETFDDLSAGVDSENDTWEIVVKYNSQSEDIFVNTITTSYPGTLVYPLLCNYSVIVTSRENVNLIAAEPVIEYVEKPKILYFDLINEKRESCVTGVTGGTALMLPSLSGRGVAVDAVFDSVSVATTFRASLAEKGIIFCSFSEAVKEHPDLVRKYLASVVPAGDNYFAALNSAVFSDGSFCYIPKGVKCPMDLSSYFRINAAGTGQFERTLIIADEGSSLSYMEGCTAPMRDENQLHAAVVEIIVEKDADVRYSTVQNWYPGDADGKGGILNLVTKRGICRGSGAHLSWTQVETGSAITWKYPSTILKGDFSSSEFYSVAVTNNYQQADTGTKMIHLGRGTTSRIVSKGISAGHSQNSYRGLVRMNPGAEGARNHSQCDSLLIGSLCGAHTFPEIQSLNPTATVEHEATTSKISDEQLFYCNQRGLGPEDAVGLIVNGYAHEVLARLPMEFAVEATKLLQVSLEGSIG